MNKLSGSIFFFIYFSFLKLIGDNSEKYFDKGKYGIGTFK